MYVVPCWEYRTLHWMLDKRGMAGLSEKPDKPDRAEPSME